jgi:hypothetical protein
LGFLVEKKIFVGEILNVTRKVASKEITLKETVIGALVKFHDFNFRLTGLQYCFFFRKSARFPNIFTSLNTFLVPHIVMNVKPW